MKVKDMKLILNEIDDELELLYHSWDEGTVTEIESIQVTKDRRGFIVKNNGYEKDPNAKDVALIEQCKREY